ncbi:MAG TPA: hypothetical protein VNY73_01550 [Bacteroidia bacterium]|jgi:hypothetical protein|nr:hypothetical protein [Bacteroidia bacterium]
MKIIIDNRRTISAVQHEFSTMFPNLIIEFYAKESREGAKHPTNLVKKNHTLAACRAEHNNGTIVVSPGMTSTNLKQTFADIYGLSAEIFKKTQSGRLLVSDKLSLQEEDQLEIRI